MTNRAVARVELDGTARSKIATGVNTVFTNNKKTAHEGSITQRGNAVVQGATTVFVENKPIARAGDLVAREGAILQGSNNVFASDILAATVDANAVSVVALNTQAYVGNPQQYNNTVAAQNGVKQYYTPVPVAVTAPTENRDPVASSNDLIPWLEARLEEADRGLWRESGQRGRPSNPRILNVWTELGFSQSSPWNTDQTAWCAGFVNYALKNCGYRWAPEALTVAFQNNPKRWKAQVVSIKDAQPGDIVRWNFSHVSFIYQIAGGKYSFVGGNQTPKAVAGKNNNPDDGDLTVAWGGPTGKTPIWTPSQGGITIVLRPSKT
jgi:uncharacterized Zn-binding protein involved in type VI secretion